MSLPDPKNVAKRVIAAYGGSGKAFAAADKNIAEFNSLWLQDAEKIGRILKAHLTVEHFLTRYIEYKNPMIAPLSEARVTFSQKIELLHPSDPVASALKPGLRRLNQVRNRLAHNLKVAVGKEDTNTFLSVAIFSAMRKELAKRLGSKLSGDPITIFEEFAKFAASLLQAGSSSESKIWADAIWGKRRKGLTRRSPLGKIKE